MPTVLVFAGPNGSGKSTVTSGFDIIGEYINADEIKKRLSLSDLNAAKYATALREKALRQRRDFTFETVLSSPRNVELLQRAKHMGYRIELIFILTQNVDINISRVQNRVKNGGHDVPIDKICSRYAKSLKNLSLVLPLCDVAWVVDNSEDKAKLIIHSKDGFLSFFETEYWTHERLKALSLGK